MAYIVNEASTMGDESSLMDGTIENSQVGTANMTRTFLSALDAPPAHFAHPQYPRVALPGACRNLLDAIEESDQSAWLLPPPPAKETLKVFLRVKPKTLEETEIIQADHEAQNPSEDASWRNESASGAPPMVQIETDYQVALNAPKESNTFKNSVNGAGSLTHRYTFTKIFPPETDQSALFQEMVMPRVREFLEGSNQLVFTYGATSSGKTYTIQGTAFNPGILPRALDVIFNSVGEDDNSVPDLRPNCFNRVVQMKERDLKKSEEDKMAVFNLGRELQLQGRLQGTSKMSGVSQLSEDSQNLADLTNLSQQSLATMFPFLANRHREESHVELEQRDIKYALWISFAEIYNENVHDLLEKIPTSKNKNHKPRRVPLKLAEDKNGSIYVRGLKEVKVNSANEAYQIMMIGRENLHFAATRLNHHSSRSHCIFSIKAIRVADINKPHLARVSMLTFCDLAGSERIKKTMNTGDRQKEAGNINTSLLVLGRCIKAIRHNQSNPKKPQIVPFRESKLTRMFQSFLVGHGKASMVVNISQAPYLFDESMQVLKFSAIASKITVQTIKEPVTVKLNNKKKKQTRFSIMVESNRSGNNLLMGRGSIAWEKPAARSTMCPMTPIVDSTLMDETGVMEQTVVDERYESLLKLIDSLKDQLIKEKQDNITLEQEIRTELCTEFNKMMVDIEESWEKRLQDQKERDEELSEWRLNKLQEVYKSRRKRQREESSAPNETMMFMKDEIELELEDKKTQLKCLEDKVEAMSKAQGGLMGENKRLQEELTKGSFQLSAEKKHASLLEAQVQDLKRELTSSNAAKMASIEGSSATPVIQDLERQLQESQEKREELEEEKKHLKELLDEAGQDFLEKSEEVRKINLTLKDCEQQLVQQAIALNELNSQLEESRLLLTDSATRMEEKEKLIADLEELADKKSEAEEELTQKLRDVQARLQDSETEKQVLSEKIRRHEEEVAKLNEDHGSKQESLEKELESLKKQMDSNAHIIAKLEGEIDCKGENLQELKAMIEKKKSDASDDIEKNFRKAESDKERLERELNDEIEDLKQAKKKLRQTVDEQTKDLENKEKEVTKLEREVKSLIQAEKNQREVNEELQSEIAMLRKQLKDLNKGPSKSDMETLSKQLQDLKTKIERLEMENSSLKKEDNAFQILNDELSKRAKEKDDLISKVARLEHDIEAKCYDIKKTKEEHKAMMDHYDQKLSVKSNELAMEKREVMKLREVMARSTPNKASVSARGSEVAMLREELMKKTEVIKNLESMIPTRKELSYSSDEEDPDVRKEMDKLRKEIDIMKATHEKELARIKKASDKAIAEYKHTNSELLRQMTCPPSAASSASSSMVSDPCAMEADDSQNDNSLIEETPSNSRKRRRGGRTAKERSRRANRTASSKTGGATQASFEDSTLENDPDFDQDSKPKRSIRLTRAKPVRKAAKKELSLDESSNSSVLKDLHNNRGGDPDNSARDSHTPVSQNARKQRTLYKESKEAQVFTPPLEDIGGPTMTPNTIVKRQLRSRSSRKK